MAVESFLPGTSEPKTTIEKEVRQKPSVDERTTIETPGRQMPADEIEQDKMQVKKPKKRSAKPKRTAEEIEFVRDSTLIITEKPQAALKIASALGNARKYNDNNVSFYELTRNSKKIIVASAVGHLFNLTYAEGERGWPIFKTMWIPSYVRATFTQRYYELIKKLAKRAKEVIIASVDYNEITPVLENGQFKLTKIGELVESIKTGKKEIKDYLIPSFNQQGKIRWNKLKNAIRHKINDGLYEISLEYGRKVKLTSSHNIFKLKNNKIELAKTTDLKIGESILCPALLPTPQESIKSISLLDLVKKEKNREIYVAGKDIAKILQNRVMNKIRKDSPLHEKRFLLTQKGIDKIKSVRLETGYSTGQIANLAQISQASVSLW